MSTTAAVTTAAPTAWAVNISDKKKLGFDALVDTVVYVIVGYGASAGGLLKKPKIFEILSYGGTDVLSRHGWLNWMNSTCKFEYEWTKDTTIPRDIQIGLVSLLVSLVIGKMLSRDYSMRDFTDNFVRTAIATVANIIVDKLVLEN